MKESKFNLLKLILLLICVLNSSTSFAQSKKLVASDSSYKTYISNDSTSVRLGKGVVAWIYQIGDGFDFASQHYLSCDGRYISDSINVQTSAATTKFEREVELQKLVKQKQSFSISAAEVFDFESSELELKNKIRTHVKEVCANASRESKEYLFPFAQTSKDKDNEFSVLNIVSGSFTRKGEIVEGWTRTYGVKSKEFRRSNGEIFYNKNGTALMTSEVKDNSYQMIRYSVNCKDEKTAEIASAQYDSYGQLKPNSSFSAVKPNYDFSIPQTVGAKIVSVFCTIY